ncbi:molybdenum cofactor guanylyltransferase [Virgibacillus sp. W0181]|uniref:molybdenum cofactor guanylyltransferase n=1 Tax=Virgibacillus sp. W0181 TaxID=3391581 RepID=UPI003F45F24D
MRTCGVILSGGKSSRMGTNKALLPVEGKPTIQHISETINQCAEQVYVIANNQSDYTFLGHQQFSDRYKEKGPLAGLESALYHIDADVFLLAACDMPFLQIDVYKALLAQTEGYDAVIPVFEGRIHPLCGIYKKTTLVTIQQQIEADDLKIKHFLDRVRVNYVHTFPGILNKMLHRHFFNMNDLSQYETAKLL